MTRTWVGIDIAKLKFDVAIVFEDKRNFHKVFANNQKGFIEFAKWLATFNLKDPHFCLEATGIYGYELAYFLHAKAYRVSVINPARIKAYAASEGVRNKTDKIDSYVISRFCKSHDPKDWVHLLLMCMNCRACIAVYKVYKRILHVLITGLKAALQKVNQLKKSGRIMLRI
ncbi:MAG: transposase [Alphaproteobacteria bacterium]